MNYRTPLLLAHLSVGLSVIVVAQSPVAAPRIWDDAALADWTTPIAALNLRPAHLSAAEYYGVRGDNLRTYPIYHPDSEPAGYWDDLQRKKPEPLVDAAKLRTRADSIAAGEHAFRERIISGVAPTIRRSSHRLAIPRRFAACSSYRMARPSDRGGWSPIAASASRILPARIATSRFALMDRLRSPARADPGPREVRWSTRAFPARLDRRR